MVINERPGVYSSVDVARALPTSRRGRTLGIAAISASGEAGVCKKISSYGEALSYFGAGSAMATLIRILLLNGAYAIEAIGVPTAGAVSDYTAAFGELMKKDAVSVMVCDSQLATVHAAMKTAIMGAAENSKYRIGIVEAAGTVTAAVSAAAALNCERIVMAYPAESGTGAICGGVAAALGGVLSAGGDPALPINGAVLLGLENVDRYFTDPEINSLVAGGVTPIEFSGSELCVVRGLTTRTTTAGESDTTWRELSTVLIIDDVIPSVRSALRVRFPRVKNTAQTRGAIRTQVIIELESKLKQEIIDSYGEVTALADEIDPSVCLVSFEFTVAHGLNRISLSAHISV